MNDAPSPYSWPPAPAEVQVHCCLDLRETVVGADDELSERELPVMRQPLNGRWYPSADGFAYSEVVRFTADVPEIEHLRDGVWVGGARAERAWLEWPNGRELTIPIGDDPLYISGKGAAFSLFPIQIGLDIFTAR